MLPNYQLWLPGLLRGLTVYVLFWFQVFPTLFYDTLENLFLPGLGTILWKRLSYISDKSGSSLRPRTVTCWLVRKHCCSGQRSLAFLSCWAVMRLRETPSHEQSRTLRCWALLRGAAGALTRTFWFVCSCLSRETINVPNPQDWHIFGETIFQMSNLS